MSSALSCPPEELLGPLSPHEAKQAPEQLWYRGDPALLGPTPRVCIVGSRDASEAALRRASRLSRELCAQDVVVVSGLAQGVDRMAHESAMQAGGRTIAVIGTPIDRVYPREHTELQEAIARDHLLVSQFTPGSRGGKWTFPARNKTMALVSHATVIVEAGASSGTKSQGWEAIRLGRPLFFMRSFLEGSPPDWVAEMTRYGAQPLTRTEDLLECIPRIGIELEHDEVEF